MKTWPKMCFEGGLELGRLRTRAVLSEENTISHTFLMITKLFELWQGAKFPVFFSLRLGLFCLEHWWVFHSIFLMSVPHACNFNSWRLIFWKLDSNTIFFCQLKRWTMVGKLFRFITVLILIWHEDFCKVFLFYLMKENNLVKQHFISRIPNRGITISELVRIDDCFYLRFLNIQPAVLMKASSSKWSCQLLVGICGLICDSKIDDRTNKLPEFHNESSSICEGRMLFHSWNIDMPVSFYKDAFIME